MISSIFGPEYIVIDLFFAAIAEGLIILLVTVLLSQLFSWIYDFNGAMRIYRQMKKPSKGGIK